MSIRRCVGFWLVAVSFLAAASASADEVSDYDRFELWNGCKHIGLVVEGQTAGAVKIPLREKDIETAVRSRLRGARIYDDGMANAVLVVSVNIAGPALHIGLEFLRDVEVLLPFWEKPEGMRSLIGKAETWQSGSTGTHGNDPSHILGGVARHTDNFIDEYLRVNADACE